MNIMDNFQSRAWTCLFVVLYFFYTIMQLTLLNTFSHALLQQNHFNNLQYGELSSIYLYTLGIVLIPAGIILDRFSTKYTVLITLGLLVIANLLFSLVNSFGIELLYRAIAGIGNAFAFLAMLKIVRNEFPKHIALSTGIAISIGMSGGIVASAPVAWLQTLLPWQTIAFAISQFGFLLWLLTAIFFHDQKIESEQTQTSLKKFIKQLPTILRTTDNILCGCYTGLLNLSVYLIATMVGNIYLVNQFNLSITEASLISSMIFIGIIIGSPLVGWITEKTKRRKLIMVIGGVVTCLLMIFLLSTDQISVIFLLILFLLLGLFSSTQVLSYPIVAEVNNQQFINTAMSFTLLLVNMIGGVVQMIFSYLVMILMQNKGMLTHQAFHHALIIAPVTFLLAAIIALKIKAKNSYYDIEANSHSCLN